jgi:competence protein ComGF
MAKTNQLDRFFDDLLFQTQRGRVTHEQLDKGIRYEQFEQVTAWQMKYGYKFNIYSNDHLIEGKKHFHFDNKEENILCKIDFEGNLLKTKGTNSVPTKIMKELKYFLAKDSVKKIITEMWNSKNPDLAT